MPNGRGDVVCIDCRRMWCVCYAPNEPPGAPSVACYLKKPDGRGVVVGRTVRDGHIQCFNCRRPSFFERLCWIVGGWADAWRYGRTPIPKDEGPMRGCR